MKNIFALMHCHSRFLIIKHVFSKIYENNILKKKHAEVLVLLSSLDQNAEFLTCELI